jgi:CDP-diacylglycerol--glycerol-3-phosphate 3-phosphatidyltransferase
VVLVVIGALLAEFAGVLAHAVDAPRRFEGPMGKSDRAFAFGVIALLIGLGAGTAWYNGILGAALLLSGLTVFNRLRRALQAGAPTTP